MTTMTSLHPLPEDIMELISFKLDAVSFHCFGSVCRSWGSIATTAKKRWSSCLYPQLPCLMLSSSREAHHHRIFSLSHGKVLRLDFLQPHQARCCGSSCGWLIMEKQSQTIFLFNPFSTIRNEIHLPNRINPRPDTEFLRKAILLSPPVSVPESDSVVVVIDNHGLLSFCGLEDQAWTEIHECYGWISSNDFEDIIFYNHQVYAITRYCELVDVDLGRNPGGRRKLTSCDITYPDDDGGEGYCSKTIYLVECLGELLMVIRVWDPMGFCNCQDGNNWSTHPIRTKMFKIFKLDSKKRCWTMVKDLGHQLLFLGSTNGISLSALDYPSFKGNCIYFTETIPHEACSDRGVFHLKDKSFKPLILDNGFSSASGSLCSTPILW